MPPLSPAPVSRPALLTASRSTSAAPGGCATYALRAATAPSSSLIFSAMSAFSSIEESPVREKAHHITKTSSTVTPAERDGRRPFRIGSLKTYLVRHSIERRRPQGEHHESSYRICGPRAGVPGHHRSLYPSSSRRLGPARLWSSPWRSPSRLLGLEAQTLPASPWPLAAARTSALRRLSDAALPASAFLSCSMRGGSGQHWMITQAEADHPPPSDQSAAAHRTIIAFRN